MVSPETEEFVRRHLEICDECSSELQAIKGGEEPAYVDQTQKTGADASKPFKRMMKRMNRQFYMLSYSLIMFFIFLGFSLTGGEDLMYNSLIMPIVGVFGYCVFKWRAIYKMPILLFVIDLLVCLFGLVELDLYSVFMWTLIYSIFVLTGIAIAFLLHYAFRKERE